MSSCWELTGLLVVSEASSVRGEKSPDWPRLCLVFCGGGWLGTGTETVGMDTGGPVERAGGSLEAGCGEQHQGSSMNIQNEMESANQSSPWAWWPSLAAPTSQAASSLPFGFPP